MTRRPPALAALVAVLLLAAGCSDGSGSPGSAKSDDATTPSRTPSASASATDPPLEAAPTTYTDAQLTAALPRGDRQLHGVRVTQQCRRFDGCGTPADAGVAQVAGSRGDRRSLDFAVGVWRRTTPALTRTFEESCPQGRYARNLEWLDQRSYRPGERGTSRRTPWEVGGWTGWVCVKHVVFLWPKGEHSKPGTVAFAMLSNGRHTLRAEGSDLAEARAIASEYLDRLAGWLAG